MIKNLIERYQALGEDEHLAYTVISPIVLLTIQYVFIVIFRVSSANGIWVSTLTKALSGLVFFSALPIVLRRNTRLFISVYSLSILVFASQYVLFPQNIPYLNTLLFPFFFMGLPMFLFTVSVQDAHVFYRSLTQAANIVFIVSAVFGVLLLLQIVKLKKYSMPFSYYMLYPLLIDMEIYLSTKHRVRLFRVMITLALILIYGSRGPLLCFFVFMLLKLAVHWRWLLNRKHALIATFSSLGVILLYVFRLSYLQVVIDVLAFFNIRSRSLILLLRNGIYLTNREEIYATLWNGFTRNWLFGNGIAGDRYLLEGSYAHNVVLELMVGFGLFLGLVLVVMLAIKIVRLYRVKEPSFRRLLDFALAFGFVHLWVSSSLFEDFRFWMFVGILFLRTPLDAWLSSLSIFKRLDPWIEKIEGWGKKVFLQIISRIHELRGNNV